MKQENNITEVVDVPAGTTITPIEEFLPITVKRLTDDYIKALEKLNGSAIECVTVCVTRCTSRDAWGALMSEEVVDMTTEIRTH